MVDFRQTSGIVTPPKKRRNSRAKTPPGQMELSVGNVQFPAVISPLANPMDPGLAERGRMDERLPERPKRPRKVAPGRPERERDGGVGELDREVSGGTQAGEEQGPADEALNDLRPETKPKAKRARKANRRRAVRRWWHPYWNLMVGFWFVPFAIIFSDAFLEVWSKAMTGGRGLPFWMKHEFLMFALGGGLWFVWLGYCLWRWREPRPIYVYVLGHELTHAAITLLFFGKVSRFRATSDGGYIEANRYNFLIALAPYLWPFYSIPVLAAWALSLLVPGMMHYREWFLIGLGFTWMFHLTFTMWMMPKGQTDFHGPGLLFSGILIYTVNVILLTGALVSLAPAISWRGYFAQLLESGVWFYGSIVDAGIWLVTSVGQIFSLLLA